MVKDNSKTPSLWSRFVSFKDAVYKIINKILNAYTRSNRKNHLIIEGIQLTFIYYFAAITVSYMCQSFMGGFPPIVFQLFLFFTNVLSNNWMKLLSSPEKTFILYIFLIELILTKSRFNFSLLVKYNILLVFILEMCQNLFVSYFDIFINRDIEYLYEGGQEIWAEDLAHGFFLALYFCTIGTYFYCYSRAIIGKFPVFPGPARFFTDSIAFWLKIDVSPKGRGKRKKQFPK